MFPGERPGTLRASRPSLALGIAASVLLVAAATAAIYGLKALAPVVSLSVVYLPAVVLVSAYWGLTLGLATSLLSAAAFNFFHLPPTGRFTIADTRNWVALGAFIIVAAAVSTMAELARSRALEAERGRAEADLAAALARELLGGSETAAALAVAAHRIAEALGMPSAALELGVAQANERRRAFALKGTDGTQVATLLVPRDLPDETEQRLNERVVPALGALVAIALQPRRAAGRGGRDRRAAAQRRRQDRAAARGLPRPADTGDRDRRRRPRARDRLADGRGASRAERRGRRRRRAARVAGRQPARPLPAPGRRRAAARGLGLARGRAADGARRAGAARRACD